MRRVDWFALGLIAYLFWIYDVFSPYLYSTVTPNEYLTAVCLGISIGQVNLIGAWGALAPGKVVVRLPWVALLGVLMWQGVALGYRFESRFPASDLLFVGITITFGVVVTQVPLWIARWQFGWRLLPPGFAADKVAKVDTQFNLRELFGGVFFLSLALGLVRMTIRDVDLGKLDLDDVFFVLLPVAAVVNALVTSPCIWIAFRSGQTMQVWAVAWVLYVLLVSITEIVALYLFLGPPGGEFIPWLVATILNVTQCLTVLVTMFLLRAIGFRLVRAMPEPKTPQPQRGG